MDLAALSQELPPCCKVCWEQCVFVGGGCVCVCLYMALRMHICKCACVFIVLRFILLC